MKDREGAWKGQKGKGEEGTPLTPIPGSATVCFSATNWKNQEYAKSSIIGAKFGLMHIANLHQRYMKCRNVCVNILDRKVGTRTVVGGLTSQLSCQKIGLYPVVVTE